MVVHAAVSKETARLSGAYFSRCSIAQCSKTAEDTKLASQLWQRSSEILELEQQLPAEYIL